MKSLSYLLSCSVLPFAMCAPLGAQALAMEADDGSIVVTASRSAEGVDRELLGASVTLLSPEDLQDRQVAVVSDILRDVAGVHVNRSGAIGSVTAVRIRGAESNHTMILVDGVEASDPATGMFDFASLFADEAARIEVLRGEQSSLYGSDAIGGVIHYITADGRDRPGLSVKAEAGSFGTWQVGGRVAGVADKLDYAITGSIFETDGYVVAPEGSRKIGASNRNLGGKFGYDLGDVRLRAVGRFSRIEADSNDQDYDFTGNAIDAGGGNHAENFYGLIGAAFNTGDNWSQDISVQHANSTRDYYDDDDAYIRGSVGTRTRASWVSHLKLGSSGPLEHSLTGAVDYERETYRNNGPISRANPLRVIRNWGFVGQYQMTVADRGSLSLAMRYDDNSRFQDSVSWRAQGSWKLTEQTRFHAAVGTGVKAPTFAELYGYSPTANYVGNPELKAEKSLGWEIGLSRKLLNDAVVIEATYFSADLEDQIIDLFAPVYTSINAAGETSHNGVEVNISANLGRGLSISGQYTHINARDDFDNQLIRRPRHLASANLTWRAEDDAATVNLNVRHNGGFLDTNFATYQTLLLPAFTLVNLSADVRLTDMVRLTGRVENMFDDNYVENVGYRAMGRAAYAGFRVNF